MFIQWWEPKKNGFPTSHKSTNLGELLQFTIDRDTHLLDMETNWGVNIQIGSLLVLNHPFFVGHPSAFTHYSTYPLPTLNHNGPKCRPSFQLAKPSMQL